MISPQIRTDFTESFSTIGTPVALSALTNGVAGYNGHVDLAKKL
jgi:hypothetical protein